MADAIYKELLPKSISSTPVLKKVLYFKKYKNM